MSEKKSSRDDTQGSPTSVESEGSEGAEPGRKIKKD